MEQLGGIGDDDDHEGPRLEHEEHHVEYPEQDVDAYVESHVLAGFALVGGRPDVEPEGCTMSAFEDSGVRGRLALGASKTDVAKRKGAESRERVFAHGPDIRVQGVRVAFAPRRLRRVGRGGIGDRSDFLQGDFFFEPFVLDFFRHDGLDLLDGRPLEPQAVDVAVRRVQVVEAALLGDASALVENDNVLGVREQLDWSTSDQNFRGDTRRTVVGGEDYCRAVPTQQAAGAQDGREALGVRVRVQPLQDVVQDDDGLAVVDRAREGLGQRQLDLRAPRGAHIRPAVSARR